jgi:methionyl-tRNA synthetase
VGSAEAWHARWQARGHLPCVQERNKEALLAKLHELAEADLERDKPKEASKPVESQPPQVPASGSPAPAAPVQVAAKITLDDFAKVELRVGEVLFAEPVAGAQRLLKLMVDIGSEVRQVVAGVAEHYTPEHLVGMKVVLVANLQPRKLRGVESNGMILAASVGEEGRPVLATFKEDVPKGSKLK